MKVKILFFLFLSQVFISAQIDTTVYYPLEIGNYWEYVDVFSGDIQRSSIIGDTLMPNGKKYYVFSNYFTYKQRYQRVDNNQRVYGYFTESCKNEEDLLYDFSISDSSIWLICDSLITDGIYYFYHGISETSYKYYTIFNNSFETKIFGPALVEVSNLGADTSWNAVGPDYVIVEIAKGIGLTNAKVELGGNWRLVGAIINDKEYGTITSIYNDEENSNPIKFDISVYPNPFNSTVVIKITLPSAGVTEINLYNIMGQKISTLLNKYKTAGSYSIRYNADHLSSGIYLIVLNQHNNYTIKKIILLK